MSKQQDIYTTQQTTNTYTKHTIYAYTNQKTDKQQRKQRNTHTGTKTAHTETIYIHRKPTSTHTT